MDKIEPYLHKSFWDLICRVFFLLKISSPPSPQKVHVFLKLLDLSKLHARPLFLPTWEYFVGVRGFAFQQSKLLIPEIFSNERRRAKCSLDFATWKRKKIKSKMKRVKNLPLDLGWLFKSWTTHAKWPLSFWDKNYQLRPTSQLNSNRAFLLVHKLKSAPRNLHYESRLKYIYIYIPQVVNKCWTLYSWIGLMARKKRIATNLESQFTTFTANVPAFTNILTSMF